MTSDGSGEPIILSPDQVGRGLTPMATPDAPRQVQAPSAFGENGYISAAFGLHNDVVNAVDILTRPSYQADPNYRVLDDPTIRGTRYESQYLSDFLGVRSAAEAAAVRARIDREEQLKQIYDRSGFMGGVAGFAAGVLSPTMLIPIGGWFGLAGKGIRALRVAEGAAASAGAVALQEGVLHAAQETRTMQESAYSVGAAALLGGVFGAISRGMPPAEFAGHLATLEDHLSAPDAVGVGAQSVEAARGGGEQAGSLGVGRALKFLTPKSRTQMSELPATRNTVRDLIAGNALEENYAAGIARSEGGDVESRMGAAIGQQHDVMEKYRELYGRYFFGEARAASPVRAMLSRALGQGGDRMSFDQFMEEVSAARLAGDTHAIPQVAEAAQYARAKLINPYRDEAMNIVPGFREMVNAGSADQSYLTRMWNRVAVKVRFNELVGILGDHFGERQDAARQAEEALTKQAEEKAFAAEQSRSQVEQQLAQYKQRQIDLQQQVAEAKTAQAGASAELKARTAAYERERAAASRARTTLYRGLLADLKRGRPREPLASEVGAAKMENIRALSAELDRAGVSHETMTPEDLAKFMGDGKRASPAMSKLSSEIEQIAQRFDKATMTVADLERMVSDLHDLAPDLAESTKASRAASQQSSAEARAAQRELDQLREFTRMSPDELRSMATDTVNQILGQAPGRMFMPGEFVKMKRGPLAERTLASLPTSKVWDFVERNAEKIDHHYARTMAADINLVRKFGSVDMIDRLQKIVDEADALKAGKSEAEQARLEKVKQADLRDVQAMRDILRGTYGLPDNPDGFLHRAVLATKTLNFLSSLGMMTVSSISDLGKPVFVHGLTRTMRTAFAPFVQGLRAFRLARKDAKLAGVGLDMIGGDRVLSLNELANQYAHGTIVERGLNQAGRAFGFITLMSPWNAVLKQFSAIVTMTRALEGVEALSKGTIGAAERGYLAEGGITPALADRIHAQWTQFGGEDGPVRWAGMDHWTDNEAATALKALINRDVNRIIVTPGVGDKPLKMYGDVGSLIGQFQSFALASVQHTLVAGLQQRDAAVFNGVMVMLALGALSYKLKSDLAGMATSDDPRVWAAEALDNSGVLGVLMNADHALEKVTSDRLGISALTGQPFRRYANVNVMGAFLGPTFGKATDALDVVSALFRGKVTQSDIRKVRKMIPLQNLLFIRQAFDAVEAGVNNSLGIPMKQ